MVAWTMAGRESLLGVLTKWLGRRHVQVSAFLAVALRFVLMAAGFGVASFGVWTYSHGAGYIAAGLSLLVLEAMVKRR